MAYEDYMAVIYDGSHHHAVEARLRPIQNGAMHHRSIRSAAVDISVRQPPIFWIGALPPKFERRAAEALSAVSVLN